MSQMWPSYLAQSMIWQDSKVSKDTHHKGPLQYNKFLIILFVILSSDINRLTDITPWPGQVDPLDLTL